MIGLSEPFEVKGLDDDSDMEYFLKRGKGARKLVDSPARSDRHAICEMNPDGNSGVSGTVELFQPAGGKTKIIAKIKGLKKGKHGFHIHQFGNLLKGCKTAGPRFNPFK